MEDFEGKIETLDLGLLSEIPSQTTPDDKRSLLAIQSAVRDLHPDYTYFEIGSHLGGSIQSHLVDDKCAKIISLDKRPLVQPDERGVNFGYPENSTARMLELLSNVGPVDKITAIDGESKSVNRSQITPKPQLCFIDGEHTDVATEIDFDLCLSILDSSGAIVFHDSYIIYRAIRACIDKLAAKNISFQAYNLPSVVFVIEINDFPLHKSRHISDLLVENYKGYLFSHEQNDEYRRFTTSFPIRYIWKLLIKLGIKI
ncbi:MAG: class I SAM-dependent methyltransferase [Acidobacteriota bacterium]